MVPCCLGENLRDCNKTCVRTTGLKSLADFTEEGRKVLLWRGGKRYASLMQTSCTYATTTSPNEEGYRSRGSHVKGGHKISLRLATKLLDHRYDCIPSWQLCRTCYDIAQKIEKNVGKEMSQSEHESPQINKLDSATTDYSTSDIDSDEARK